jgi:hypothetical protein
MTGKSHAKRFVVLIVHAVHHQRSEACDVQNWVLQVTAAIATKWRGSVKVNPARNPL